MAANTHPCKERLSRLRAELARREVRLDGFVVPRADEHQGEYVPAGAQRLGWLTGFTGSAGAAVVLKDRAAIFVDGRYTLQVGQETDLSLYEHHHLIEAPPETWIRANLPRGAALGFDPWLHTLTQTRALRLACEAAGGELVACGPNPVDAIWTDRPPPPISPIRVHGLAHSGQPSVEKRAALGKELTEAGVRAAVLTLPDAICWLLNIRGADLPHNPVVLAMALCHDDGRVTLFVDPRKVDEEVRTHLGEAVEVRPPETFGAALHALAAGHAKVRIDPGACPQWVVDQLEGAKLVEASDPCARPKAVKNAVELEGMRQAHRRDGAAVARFLAWLAREAGDGPIDELQAAAQLHAMRQDSGALLDTSFETISGAGPNGAIVHYRVTEDSNRRLEPGSLYLVDSGGQYVDGTTDITRTVAIGTPTAEMRDRFTRVLQGHIGLDTARFPRGTTGSQLDALARLPLWRAGLDYDHGTGHGVGSHLCVHEGPHSISKRPNPVPLEPGMIVSNEPGYYKTGAYGIRIENLIAVVPIDDIEGAERQMLGFEALTVVPIARDLIDCSLLSAAERSWVDAYHRRVREALTPLVDAETATWLAAETAPLAD